MKLLKEANTVQINIFNIQESCRSKDAHWLNPLLYKCESGL